MIEALQGVGVPSRDVLRDVADHRAAHLPAWGWLVTLLAIFGHR